MNNVRPTETRNNVAHNKNYHLDPALETAKKIPLRRINKTGLQDNYEGPFDVIARSHRQWSHRQCNNLSRIALFHVIRGSTSFGRRNISWSHCVHTNCGYPSPPPRVPVQLQPPQNDDQYYRTRSSRTVRPPSRYLDMVSSALSSCDFAYPEEGGNVAYATPIHAT